MQQIRQYFEQITPLSDPEWALFASRLTRQEFPKKHILLNLGQKENYLSFLEKGLIRFYVPGEVEDMTFSFAFEHHFFSAYDSFLTQTPCRYQVECLADSAIWRISHADLQMIYQQTSVGNRIGRHAGEQLYLLKIRREMSLLTESAEQRYLNLFTQQPELIRRIPLKYIASYIGITPQALSRIRRRIS